MSDASPSAGTATTRVELGRFVLVIGDRAGTAIADDGTQGDPGALAKAIERSSKEPPAPLEAGRTPDETIEDAAAVTDRLEHALHLFTEFAEGRRDLASIGDEANFLLDLLQRLDHDERWTEAIQVARVLAKLLALLARWKDLLSSLRLAFSLAEQISDDDGKAWALHELGILHLAAGKRAAADPLLTRAHEIRKRTPDRRAQTLLERNLQVFCRSLRADLHASRWRQFKQIPNARAIAAALAASLLVLGGVAGAIVNGSGGSTPPKSSVTIDASPEFPRPGEQVTFKVVTNTKADPYFWWFGDGRSSSAANPQHVYGQPGLYRAIVTVTNSEGAILGSASHLIEVTRYRTHPTTKPPTGKLPTAKGPTETSTKRSVSTITSSCPSSPVIFGTSVTVSGIVRPTPAAETPVTIVYTTPSKAIQREIVSTDTEGAYTSVSKADQVGEWSVSSSWSGDTSVAPATSEGCSFEVRTREELLRGPVKATEKPGTVSRPSPFLPAG